jgi:hypothetical protein
MGSSLGSKNIIIIIMIVLYCICRVQYYTIQY